VHSVNYESLARDLLRALRGQRSQVGFSRRLKYRSNVAYLWESGRNWPTASTALWAAERTGVNVRGAIERFYRTPPGWLGEVDVVSRPGVARLLDDLRGDTPILELAARTERSRFAVARWLKGDAEPRLPDFLRLLEASSQRVLDFVSQLVDVARLPSAAPAWRALQAARRLVAQLPWSPAVLLVLQTEDYAHLPRHEPGWIARRLGLPVEVERECLELLATSGQIESVRGRWRVGRVQSIDTRTDPAAGKRLKEWWAQVGIDFIRADRPGLFSFNVFSISAADLARLEDMHRSYYRTLRAVVAASEPPERVVVANLQLFPLDQPALE
jgi:hypothetical protein